MWNWTSSPTEIIGHVFLLCTVASVDSGSVDLLYRSTTLPVVLSHVCRRWRAVALSTPRLWSVLVVGIEHSSPSFDGNLPQQTSFPSATKPLLIDNISHRLRIFMSRSSRCPLRLHIDLRDVAWNFQLPESSHPSDVMAEQLNGVFDIIFTHIHRWQDVEVLSDTWLPQYMFIKRCTHFPIPPKLRHLSLARCNAYFALEGALFSPVSLGRHIGLFQPTGQGGDSFSPSLSDDERCAPSHVLRSISLAGVHVDWGNCGSIFNGLTRLELKYHAADVLPSLSELTKMLRSSEGLESLSIVGWGHRHSTSDGERLSDHGFRVTDANSLVDRHRIRLPHLTEFTFGWVDASHASSLLSSVFTQEQNPFPALAELVLEDVTNSLDPPSARDSSPVLNNLSHILTVPSSYPIAQRAPIRRVCLRHIFASTSSEMRLIAACGRRYGIEEMAIQGINENLLIALLRMVVASDDRGQENDAESHTCKNSQKDQAGFFLDRLTIQEGNFCVDASALRVFLQVFPVPVDFESDGVFADFEDEFSGGLDMPGVSSGCQFEDPANWNPSVSRIPIPDTSPSLTNDRASSKRINAEDTNTLAISCDHGLLGPADPAVIWRRHSTNVFDVHRLPATA